MCNVNFQRIRFNQMSIQKVSDASCYGRLSFFSMDGFWGRGCSNPSSGTRPLLHLKFPPFGSTFRHSILAERAYNFLNAPISTINEGGSAYQNMEFFGQNLQNVALKTAFLDCFFKNLTAALNILSK